MAVYKPNYCYPYLEGVDARLIGKNPFYFKCLIDTSNRQITGFQLTLYDNDNNEVFKGAKISPLSELPRYNTSSSVLSINSGLNGSELQIPAFQPKYDKNNSGTGLYASYNAIYYIGDYNVKAMGEMSNPAGTIDEYELRNGDFYIQKAGDSYSLYQYDKSKNPQTPITVSEGQFFNVEYGSVVNNITNANKNFKIIGTNDDGTIFTIEEFPGSLFRAFGEGDKSEPTTEVEIFNNRTVYKWQITLFQGSKGVTITDTIPKEVDYKNLSNDEFDMVLQNATILGTTSSRLQIPKTDEIILNKYVELYNSQKGQPIAGSYRKSISSYDETYGHIYPERNAFTPDLIENSDSCFVYKYSNNPDSIVASDTVAVATTGNVILAGMEAIKTGTVIDGYVLQDGDYVLVKNQDLPKENGIYIIDKAAEPSRGQYNSWGGFIGKVVFVKNGNINGKKNFISQARAGGTIDVTNLIFNKEEPLILYPENIGLSVSVMSSSQPSGGIIDKYSIMNNDLCYCIANKNVYVASVSNEGAVIWNLSVQSITEGTKINVSYGAQYGGKVFIQSGATVSQDFSSQLATLYKNTTERTFITPFLGLDQGQKIFLDNSFIRLAQDNSLTNVLSINTIDTDNWSITHVTLKVPFNSEAKIKYNLKSFFKTSDQNNFTLISTPQARYSIQNTNEANFPFGQFISIKGTDIQVPVYSQGTINTRFVVCTGNYQQPQFLNWTNYRWLLLDSYGNILQDSGYRYDGTTKIAFYGLELNRYYYTVLMMTDEMGNVLSTGFRGLVRYESIDLGINFTATYNCNKQATELYYAENGIVQPGILTEQQTLVSAEAQYTYMFNTEDTDLSETKLNNGQMYILGKKGNSLTWKPGGTSGEDAQSEGIVYGDYGLKNFSDKYEYSSLYCADNGQMKLWSSHYLDGNFNGNIIHYEIDMKNENDETFGESNFICQFEIMPVANVFNSDGQIEGSTNNGTTDTSFVNNLNSNRNKIRFRAWIKIKEGNEEKIYPITVKIPDSINENNEIVYTEYFQPVDHNNNKTSLFSISEDLSNLTYKFINPEYLDLYGNLNVETENVITETGKEFINTKNGLYKNSEGKIIVDKDCLNELGLFNSKGEKQNTNIGVNNLCLSNEPEPSGKNLSYWTDNQLVFVDSNFNNNESRAVLSTISLNEWQEEGKAWDDGNGDNYVPTEAKTHNGFDEKILKIDFQTLENFDTLRNLALDQKEIIFTEGIDDSVGYYIGSVKDMGPCMKFKAYFATPNKEETKQHEIGIGETVSGEDIDNE